MAVGADDERRVPIPDFSSLAGGGAGFDVHLFAAGAIVTHQPAVLPFAVDDIGIDRIDAGLEAIAADGDEPVFAGDACGADGAGGPALGVVVLGAAIDVIERRGGVQAHLVELGDGQVLLVVPGSTAIASFVDPAVAPHEQVVSVVGVDPQRMVIDVLAADGNPPEARPAILGDLQKGVERVDAIDIMRIADQFVVVLGAG